MSQVVREALADGGGRCYGVDFIVRRGNSRSHIDVFAESEAEG